MEIEYTSTRKEVWDFYWHLWLNGSVKWVHARMFVAFFIIVLLIEYKPNTLETLNYANAILISFCAIVFMILIPQIMFKNKKRKLSINNEGINTTIGKSSALITWKEIKSIEQRNNTIYVLGKKGSGFIIPLRAFKDKNTKTSFFEDATQFYNEAENA